MTPTDARRVSRSAFVLVGLAMGVVGCAAGAVQPPGSPVVRPGAPGQETRVLDGTPVTAILPHTAADVAFMQGMIQHHAQALEMSALIPGRTTRREIVLLGQRIVISQRDEIALMSRWLEGRGLPLPEMAAHHMMPGMLSPIQMETLRGSSDTDFDRFFLAGMIQHHEGALVMVAELFASPGAAQEEEVFQFASHVEADQRIEIARMERLLRELLTDGN
ncbi:MAG: DUF305 domain-containing protein [Gemmatimonadota bacterium]